MKDRIKVDFDSTEASILLGAGIEYNIPSDATAASFQFLEYVLNNHAYQELDLKVADEVNSIPLTTFKCETLTSIYNPLPKGGTILTWTELAVSDFEVDKLQSFEYNLWIEVSKMYASKEINSANLFLFEKLLNEVSQRNYDNCNRFISLLANEELSTICIVHILNVLSPIKQHLNFWNEFVDRCKTIIVDQRGEEAAKNLLKVIV
jgi:hypothetical protein